MKLSIIVPMYNEEKYIIHCLKSLLDQNISKNDYEILIVDDGSTDNSLSIVKKFTEKLPNSNISIHTKKNGGLSDARNFGQPLAQGKYIYFVDSDDYIASNVLRQLMECVEKNDLEILTFNCINTIDLNLKDSKNIDKVTYDVKISNGVEHMANYHFHHAVWSYIVSKKFLNQTKMTFVKDLLLEDCAYTPNLFFKANRIAHLDIDVYRYLQIKPNSIMRKVEPSHLNKMVNSHNYIFKEINKIINQLNTNVPIQNNCIKRLNNRQQTLLFFLISKLIKTNYPINKFKNDLENYKKLNVYPLNNFISEKYNGIKYEILSRIFGNKKLLMIFTMIYRKAKRY